MIGSLRSIGLMRFCRVDRGASLDRVDEARIS